MVLKGLVETFGEDVGNWFTTRGGKDRWFEQDREWNSRRTRSRIGSKADAGYSLRRILGYAHNERIWLTRVEAREKIEEFVHRWRKNL